jgi:hypothetical protein
MTLEGFDVDIRNVAKGAYRCYLKIPDLLFEQGLSSLQEEKMLIQIDTTPQGYAYRSDTMLLNKFDVFTEIRVTPLDVLLSQKIYTAVNRKRPKGRDFYDITFLFSQTKPDMGFLNQTLGVDTLESLKQEISARIAGYDFKSLAEDVSPFLVNQQDIQRVEKFREFWNQVALD